MISFVRTYSQKPLVYNSITLYLSHFSDTKNEEKIYNVKFIYGSKIPKILYIILSIYVFYFLISKAKPKKICVLPFSFFVFLNNFLTKLFIITFNII